jgi:hypothetical protein
VNQKLVAIRVQRRSLSVAIFAGSHLEHAEVYNLSSNNRKAEESTMGYGRRLISDFNINSAGMEWATNGDIRKTILTDILVAFFRDEGIPVFQAGKQELFEAFGVPALGTRKELGSVTTTIWPSLNTPGFPSSVFDAAALGLFIQTERLLHN